MFNMKKKVHSVTTMVPYICFLALEIEWFLSQQNDPGRDIVCQQKIKVPVPTLRSSSVSEADRTSYLNL